MHVFRPLLSLVLSLALPGPLALGGEPVIKPEDILGRTRASSFSESAHRDIRENLSKTLLDKFFAKANEGNIENASQVDNRDFLGLVVDYRIAVHHTLAQLNIMPPHELALHIPMFIASIFMVQQLAVNGFTDLALEQLKKMQEQELIILYNLRRLKLTAQEREAWLTTFFIEIFTAVKARAEKFTAPQDRQRIEEFSKMLLPYLTEATRMQEALGELDHANYPKSLPLKGPLYALTVGGYVIGSIIGLVAAYGAGIFAMGATGLVQDGIVTPFNLSVGAVGAVGIFAAFMKVLLNHGGHWTDKKFIHGRIRSLQNIRFAVTQKCVQVLSGNRGQP